MKKSLLIISVVVVTIVTNSFSQYCAPTSNCHTYSDVITNVTIASINNTSSCSTNGDTSYTTPTTILYTSTNYPIAVSVGNGSENVVVWIDYNQNGIFDTTEYTPLGSGQNATIHSNISIPSTATLGNTTMRVRLQEGGVFTSADACLTYTYGETEDYTITIAALTACSGTPTAGTASASTASVCSGNNFSLSLTGYVGISGLTFQWQSSATSGGTYTNIAGANDTTYTTSQTATTYYRCIVACGGSTSVSSNIVTIGMKALTNCYCKPTSDCTYGDYITNVTIASINNTSSCAANGYTSYTTPTTTLNTSTNYPISVTVGYGGTEYVSAWIDYNQNGIFDTSEYTYIGSGNSTTINSNISIPSTAALGNTVMRVRLEYGADLTSPDACLICRYGETEDYPITISLAPACSGSPTVGTASASTASVCSGTNFNLSLTGYTSGVSGITFQWQSSATSGGTYTNIAGATTPIYSTSQTATTYYKCIVTCSGANPANSNIVSVGMNSSMVCNYCTPTSHCTYGNKILNVTIDSINNTSNCSTNGYTSYNAPTATLDTSTSYPIAVTVGSGGKEYVSAWIDYNQNGTFETTEFTSIGSDSGATINSSISIPSTATSGNTIMRVRVRYDTALTPSDACLVYAYGETEDYAITIRGAHLTASCTYSISPTNTSLGSISGTSSFNVTTQNGCTWTANTTDNWIIITSGVSGSGNGTVNYSVTANTGTISRSGTIILAGQTYTVTQAGSTATGIIENSFESAITIYPNPTNGIINIQLGQIEMAQIKITDVLGNGIYQNNGASANVTIDLTADANGIYFISIQASGGIMYKKIVITH